MAIIIGTPTTGAASASGNDGTFNHTCASGTKMLVVGISVEAGNADVNNHTTLSAIKWNGNDMNTAIVRNGDGAGRATGIFYIIQPETGALSVTFTATPTLGSGIQGSFMYCVDLSGDISATIGNTQNSTAANPSVAYTVQGIAGVVFDVFQSNNDATPGGSQTSIYTNQDANGKFRAGASYQTHSGSNITNTYTGSGAPRYSGAEFTEGSMFVPQIVII